MAVFGQSVTSVMVRQMVRLTDWQYQFIFWHWSLKFSPHINLYVSTVSRLLVTTQFYQQYPNLMVFVISAIRINTMVPRHPLYTSEDNLIQGFLFTQISGHSPIKIMEVLNIFQLQDNFSIYWYEFFMPLVHLRPKCPVTKFGQQKPCWYIPHNISHEI